MKINDLFGTFTFRQTASQDLAYVGTVRGREEEAAKLRLEMARSAVEYAEREYDQRCNETSDAFQKWNKLRDQRNAQGVYLSSLRRILRNLEASIVPGAPK